MTWEPGSPRFRGGVQSSVHGRACSDSLWLFKVHVCRLTIVHSSSSSQILTLFRAPLGKREKPATPVLSGDRVLVAAPTRRWPPGQQGGPRERVLLSASLHLHPSAAVLVFPSFLWVSPFLPSLYHLSPQCIWMKCFREAKNTVGLDRLVMSFKLCPAMAEYLVEWVPGGRGWPGG